MCCSPCHTFMPTSYKLDASNQNLCDTHITDPSLHRGCGLGTPTAVSVCTIPHCHFVVGTWKNSPGPHFNATWWFPDYAVLIVRDPWSHFTWHWDVVTDKPLTASDTKTEQHRVIHVSHNAIWSLWKSCWKTWPSTTLWNYHRAGSYFGEFQPCAINFYCLPFIYMCFS